MCSRMPSNSAGMAHHGDQTTDFVVHAIRVIAELAILLLNSTLSELKESPLAAEVSEWMVVVSCMTVRGEWKVVVSCMTVRGEWMVVVSCMMVHPPRGNSSEWTLASPSLSTGDIVSVRSPCAALDPGQPGVPE